MSWSNGSSELLVVSSEYEVYSAFAWLACCESKTSQIFIILFYFLYIVLLLLLLLLCVD